MNVIGGVLLLLGAAVLSVVMRLSWLVPLVMLALLALSGLLLLFTSDDKAAKMALAWWGRIRRWFIGTGGWSLLEAIALGILVFGLFAGGEFLREPLIILAAFLAPWAAGLWAARRGTQFPALLSTLAGTVVGAVEGRYFLPALPGEWNEFPAWLLVLVVAGLFGAALGFWACARGQLRLEKKKEA